MSLNEADVLVLYDRHARDLLGYFARRDGNPELALDLVAETYLAAYVARERCRASSHDQRAAWLYTIAANKLAEHLRRCGAERRALERLREHQLRALTEAEQRHIEGLAAENEVGGPLGDALDGLSDEQHVAIHSRVLEERSYAEVAEQLGITEQAARSRVSRGLLMLRRALPPLRGSVK